MNIILDFIILQLRILFSYVMTLVRLFVPPSKKSVVGQIVLVTGAGQGIGKRVATLFSQHGAKLVLWDINEKNLNAVEAELSTNGNFVKSYVCDVSNQDQVKQVAEQVKNDVGDVDILVNNAGIMLVKPFLDLSTRDINRVIDINTKALFWTTQAFLPAMIEKNQGHIVNMASMAGLFGLPNLVDYCASKFAVVGMSEALANEMYWTKADGVKVTYVCPHIVNTNLIDVCDIVSKFPAIKLDPDYVAEEIVNGTLRNAHRVVLPKYFEPFSAYLRALPRAAQKAFGDFMGVVLVPKQ